MSGWRRDRLRMVLGRDVCQRRCCRDRGRNGGRRHTGVEMIAIGCDPGTTGAIAAVCSVRGLLEVERLPSVDRGAGKRAVNYVDATAMRDMLRDWSHRHRFAGDEVATVIEQVGAFPGLSAFGALQMGHAAGVCEAVLAATIAGPVMVRPRWWKAFYGLGKAKGASVEAVRRLYPSAPARLAHDKAEAILLAHWHLVQINGERVAA